MAASYVAAAAVVALFTAAGWSARSLLADADLSMMLLLAVVVVAYRGPLGPSLVAVGLSVAAFDFFFVPPYYTFHVSDTRYLLTFATMGVVGVTIGSLAARVRERERAANEARLLADAEQMRNALLSSVSHDLRTPLGSILGSATTLRDQVLDEEGRREMLDTIHEEAEHLMQLLDNLLRMTRLSGGDVGLRQEWHLPEEIVGAALQRLETAVAGHKVVVSIAPEIGLARFDGMLVELALVNLLENAARYSPRGTRIGVFVRATDRELIWEVTDEGPGLPPGEEERVFEKFYRIPGQRERGSGLGLAIAKAIVEAHSGRIWAGSRSGEGGARFCFALPLDLRAPEMPREEDE